MDIIFFGMQGAGKGTLGKAVAKKYNMQLFETGAELRRLSAESSELGHKVKSIIDAGHLVDNAVVMEIVENFVQNLKPGVSILFDGIPRKIEQANSLNTLLDKNGRKYRAVLINISRETALKRLTTRRICSVCKTVYPADYQNDACECGGELITRQDDNPQSIETRLKAFEEETLPAIELYKDNLIKIDGEPKIDEVEKTALEILNTVMNEPSN
ncbi:nucleoside monophosphate kinase [Candidatus Peregrinibacteria bacterium]|nr:nucleoside monophosphate kinase [Candidatus Peregrinibacteria bacterium]